MAYNSPKKITAKYYFFVIGLLLLLPWLLIAVRNPAADNSQSKLVSVRNRLLKNELAVYLLHTYHSLRKLPDVLFFPYLFKKTNLPEYSLYVSPENIVALNGVLDIDPISGNLFNENRVWVNGVFKAANYTADVKVRYRGIKANHWNSLQKSWRIKFPKSNLFNGHETLDFLIPYDRYYFIEPLNFYRSKKLGLIASETNFTKLNLNGQDSGVYLTYETFSDNWLAARKIPENTGIFSGDDSRSAADTSVDADNFIMQTGHGPVNMSKLSTGTGEDPVMALESLIEEADDETFKKNIGNLVDLKKYYAWNIVNILAGSGHKDEYFYDSNVITIFNPIIGKFEFSPWDTEIESLAEYMAEYGENYNDRSYKLSRRVFRIPEFRRERNEMLARYLNDPKNLADDLAFYDNLFNQTKPAFYGDTAKLYNNFQFIKQIKLYRERVIDNFKRCSAVLSYDTAYYSDNQSPDGSKLKLPGTFSRFFETGYTISQFLAANPAFIKRDSDTVALTAGEHILKQDVIIPYGLKLALDPGAAIRLDKGVSLISYGPVIAQGLKDKKIIFSRLNPSAAWGSFAVINTEKSKNELSFVEFDGGSGEVINGVAITGQAAFHNSQAEILNSLFRNSGDDDSLNIKYGLALVADNVFMDSLADGLDSDFADPATVIKNNKFLNGGGISGGDAIDISWGDIRVENNYIKGCSDKGISVGESSKPLIAFNQIEQCDIGIAVKDSSIAEISNNTITQARIGIDVYQKKPVFGGGAANLKNNQFIGVKTLYQKDKLSEINVIQ